MLLTDDPAAADVLNRSEVVSTIDAVLRDIAPPACVAVYGSWGAGKTSVLEMAKARWTDGGGQAVWFDPWEHERRPDILGPLILAIAAARPRSVGRPIGLLAKGLVRALGKLAGSVQWEVGIPGAKAKLSLEDSITEFRDGSREFSYKDEIKEIKEDFAALVKALVGDDDGKPLVVFLDDLDRCLPETTVTLIDAVKLLLCSRSGELGLARVVFVFGLDRQIVGEAIRNRYGGASSYTGENYLEKIFDLSIELPQVTGPAAAAFLDVLSEGIKGFRPAFGSCLAAIPAFANPRVIKRSVNRFRLFAALHGSDAPPERRLAYDKLISDDEAVARFVCWVCGSERFRSFRRYLLEVPDDELNQFNAYVAGGRAEVRARLSPEGAAIADSPGFRAYYSELARVSKNDLLAQRAGDQHSLAHIDAWLRGVGL